MDEIKKEKKHDILQTENLRILKEFIRICNENNIWYCLSAGTMLGAVRHNGFIPWDRDVDVYIKIKDVPKVTVEINTERAELPKYKDVVDEDTGEKVMAQVQVNEPIEQKSTKPPEKPVAKGDYTNPEAPPTYTEEQTKVEPKKEPVKSSTSSNTAGKVYIEGFGYVEKAGTTKVQTGVSDGDINKMVGSMD